MASSIIENQYLKDKCQIFTPSDIVTKMLDLASYKDKLYGKKVLENSCGNGEFLIQIVKRYIESCINDGLSLRKVKQGLEKDIVAYEIDNNRIKECIKKLNNISRKYKINNVKWDIRCKDFLKSNTNELFDYILGNPPYIAYPDLPEDIREYVKQNFNTCHKGKFDYSYAFIEKSYASLFDQGILVYIIPSNIFKNVFASQLRELIKPDISSIIDFPTDSVFKKVLVSPAIIKVSKGSKTTCFNYTENNKTQNINKEDLKDKWIFTETKRTRGKRLGDFFKVSSSIATLCNEVFVVRNGYFKDNYYFIDNYKIENDLLKIAASPKNKKYNKYDEYIVFPYYFDNVGALHHYSEEEMMANFPHALEYLRAYKKKLEKRKSDKNALWFEYGRSQALRNLNQPVVLISSVISDCTQAYLLQEGEIPYSGLYIIPKAEITLETIVSKLNSYDFKQYINGIGVCVSGTSKRITPSDIENYIFN